MESIKVRSMKTLAMFVWSVKLRSVNRLCLCGIYYRYVPKFSDRQVWANSADPDQTAPRGTF